MSAMARPFKRRRGAIETHLPFGFDLTPYYELISQEYGLPERTHQLNNYIKSFDESGEPTWTHPHKVWTTEKTNGLYATFKGETRQIVISGMHTKHTESLYMMAQELKKAIQRQSEAILTKKASLKFKDVDITRAIKQQRHKSTNILYLRAIHQGDFVVLKTTTDPAMQLKYILDAVIHAHLWRNSPNYVSKLHFVAFCGSSLVVCSGQMMEEKSVYSFMNTIQQRHRPDRLVYTMVHSFCLAMRRMQRQAELTHRDCHTANVYYDSRKRITKLIDFDWSCVRIGDKIISVPRFLYDTTRPQYGRNKSVDCCIFFRTLGHSLEQKDKRTGHTMCPVPIFKEKIYDPLMRRYEVDSREILRMKSVSEKAAIQIYKLSTINGKPTGRYAHKYGIARHKGNFDYMMGYYTYTSMTPEFILRFLRDNKFF
jgi:hypothetical protein